MIELFLSLIVGGALAWFAARFALRRNERDKQRIMTLLAKYPNRWFYGLDIVTLTKISRSTIYVRLAELEDEGKIERRLEELPKAHILCCPRAIYRYIS